MYYTDIDAEQSVCVCNTIECIDNWILCNLLKDSCVSHEYVRHWEKIVYFHLIAISANVSIIGSSQSLAQKLSLEVFDKLQYER